MREGFPAMRDFDYELMILIMCYDYIMNYCDELALLPSYPHLGRYVCCRSRNESD